REYLVLLSRVGAVTERAAAVAHDDVRVGKGTREVDGIRELRMELPGVEREPEPRQTLQAFPEIRLHHHVGSRGGAAVADDLARVPRRRVAHGTESSSTGADLRLQDRFDAVAEREIGEA